MEIDEERATIKYVCKRLRTASDVILFLDASMGADFSGLEKSARDGLRRILSNTLEDLDDAVEALEKIANADINKPAKPSPGEATPTPAPPFYYQG